MGPIVTQLTNHAAIYPVQQYLHMLYQQRYRHTHTHGADTNNTTSSSPSRSPSPSLSLHASHRGTRYHELYGENTLDAYKYAVVECQTDILEIDLWLTSDNTVVLHHDSIYNTLYIPDHTYTELIRSHSSNSHSNRLPTLEELLQLLPTCIPSSSLIPALFIDLKHIPAIPYITKLLHQYGMLDKCIYGAISKHVNDAAVIAVKSIQHEYHINVPLTADAERMRDFTRFYYGLINHENNQLMSDTSVKAVNQYITTYLSSYAAVGWFVELGNENDTAKRIITPQLIELFHRHNKFVFLVGSAVDDVSHQRKYIEYGVDVMFVDHPKVFRDTLNELYTATMHHMKIDENNANKMHATMNTRSSTEETPSDGYMNVKMCDARINAENTLQSFIGKYITSAKGVVTDLTGSDGDDMKFNDSDTYSEFEPIASAFGSNVDTKLYGMLLTHALRQQQQQQGEAKARHKNLTVIDLGCGSSIPTLMALLATKRRDVHIIGVDIDESALKVSEANTVKYNVQDQYTLILDNYASFIKSYQFNDIDTSYLLCTNPPYIATPDLSLNDDPSIDKQYWVTVDGGRRGDKFIRAFLERDYPSNIHINFALTWTSLSDPVACIRLFESKYRITYAEAALIRNGKYTTDKLLNPYLLEQREKGVVVFNGDAPDQQTHWIFGTLLSPKHSIP